MPSYGKISLLPRAVREELNHRLENGESGAQLLAWLNTRDDVRAVLAARFAGRAINAPNLTAWRQGGFTAWQTQRELLNRVQDVAGDAAAVAETSGSLPDHLATLIAARYALVLADWDGEPNAAALRRFRALSAVCRDLVALRKSFHHAGRLRLELEQFACKRQEALEKAERAKRRRAENEDEDDDDDEYEDKEDENPLHVIRAQADDVAREINNLVKNFPKTAHAAAMATAEARTQASPFASPSATPSAIPRAAPNDFLMAITPETPLTI
jgi:hypothetical protein